jgi:ABC-type multidrug transport system fused ATPase/permease subunit
MPLRLPWRKTPQTPPPPAAREVPKPTRVEAEPDEAEGRDLTLKRWLGSTERERALTEFIVLTAVAIGFAVISGFAFITRSAFDHDSTRLILGFGTGFCAILAYGFALARVQGSKAKFRERQERRLREKQERDLERLQNITDLATLLKLNQQRMDTYQVLSREQAQNSYKVSQLASIVGGVILLAGAVAVVAVPGLATKISVATLSGLAGLFSGYIGRTFMRVYERTLVQLNFYFQQPLIASYVLAAERLIDKMAPRRRNAAYMAVVREVLAITSRNAYPDGEDGVPAPLTRAAGGPPADA